MQVLVFEVTELPAHALLGGQLPVLPRAWGPDNTGVKKKAGAAREALGSLTELKTYARGLGNCANVGSSLGH